MKYTTSQFILKCIVPAVVALSLLSFVGAVNLGFDPTLAKAARRDIEPTDQALSISSTTTSGTVSSSSIFTSTPATVGSSSISSNQPTAVSSSTQFTVIIESTLVMKSTDPVSTTSGGGGSKIHTGAIAGGVVGGVVGLSVLAALAFFFLNRRRAGNTNNILGPRMRFNPAHDQQFYKPPRLYDPADPSTFPAPLSASDSSNSGGHTTNPYQDGRYNGAAEL